MSDLTVSTEEKKGLSVEEKENLGLRLKNKFRLAADNGDASYIQEIEDVVKAAGDEAAEVAEEYIFAYVTRNWSFFEASPRDNTGSSYKVRNVQRLFDESRPSDDVRRHLSLAAKSYLQRILDMPNDVREGSDPILVGRESYLGQWGLFSNFVPFAAHLFTNDWLQSNHIFVRVISLALEHKDKDLIMPRKVFLGRISPWIKKPKFMEKLITSKSEPCPCGPLYLEAHPGEDVKEVVVDKKRTSWWKDQISKFDDEYEERRAQRPPMAQGTEVDIV